MRYSILIKWLFVSLLATQSVAQVHQTQRFEVALLRGARAFEVASLQERGVLLHRIAWNGVENEFEIVKLDTGFKQVWRGYIPLDPTYTITHRKAHKSKFYLLSHSKNHRDFKLSELNEETGKYMQWDLHNYIPFVPSEFEVTDKAVIMGGYYNRTPIVVLFDFESSTIKVLPGLFNEIGELAQIKTYEDNTFDVLLCARYFSREKTIWMKSYTPEGDFIHQTVLSSERTKSLLFGRVLKTEDNVKVIAGVYGNRNSEFARGIFVTSIDGWGNQQLRYHNFADLENFFGYMKSKREARVKNRIERRKGKGRTNRYNYRLLVHELISYQDQFVLLGEAFYPKYKTADRSASYGFFSPGKGGYGSGNEMVFDGYRYTHATVLGFDRNGKLLWDNTFEINDVKTFNKEQFVKVKASDDRLTLLYLFNNQLKSKVINGQRVLEGKSAEPLKTLQGYAATESTALNKLEYWYDDYLFAYGVQGIIQTDSKGDRVQREVFFINKVKCN